MPSNSEWGKGLSQEDLMIKDECITLDMNDNIIGHSSKKQTHVFSEDQPRGILHRAFSVFLFNEEGKLLLQQRAREKITFPEVWTNTCCSHPLYGFDPSELDREDDVRQGIVNGVKNAAIRKLKHELGISTKTFQLSDFKYLTRLHYWAADVVTHGKSSPWGEHEIDYILFVQKKVRLHLNKEEVMATKYVTMEELLSMMRPESGLLWSPWFRIIVEKFLIYWWKDLHGTLTTNKFVDYKTIHRFDPTTEHMGGAGQAYSWLGIAASPYDDIANDAYKVGDQSLKQGAYGKVIIHKHSKFDQFSRIDEIFAALWLKSFATLPNKFECKDEDTKFCDEMLGKVSRSFAAVIRQLPRGLCLDILIFYLALRALDTIEDDMEAFKGNEKVKIEYLNNFYRTGLVTDGWCLDGVGAGDERILLQQYFRCVQVYKTLSYSSQEIIADITKRMGQGMASFVQRDLGQGTVSIDDYNQYCHYVAGLVGEGLSRLFVCTGYEDKELENVSTTLANSMGLFLQKTNIIRDYLEDYVDGRAFWPQEIWMDYTHTKKLGELAEEAYRFRAVHCLNHLVTDALKHVPDCLQYMDMIRTEEIFRFCAIPQVMAIATLAELYDNKKVFTGVVKIRKGFAAKLLLDTKTRGGLHKWFYLMAGTIRERVSHEDPNAAQTEEICNRIIKLTQDDAQLAIAGSYARCTSFVAVVAIIIVGYHIFVLSHDDYTVKANDILSVPKIFRALIVNGNSSLLVGIMMLCGCSLYILAYAIVSSKQKRLIKGD